MSYYVRSVDEVEKATGMDFFYKLDEQVETRIESKCDLNEWQPKEQQLVPQYVKIIQKK